MIHWCSILRDRGLVGGRRVEKGKRERERRKGERGRERGVRER